jgi:membrane protein
MRAVDWTTLFSSALLLSLIPLLVLLGSLANEQIDADISRHIGLDHQAEHIVHELFRSTPTHAFVPIATGLIIGIVGSLAVVSSLTVIYERVYDPEPRGWRNLLRSIVWMIGLIVALVVEAFISGPVRTALGEVVQRILTMAGAGIFFWWTMHLLLGGRVPARRLLRPAIVTGVLWVGLALFSSVYFSPIIISDSKLYGTIGVVFSLVTWFIIIGAVVVVGAVAGEVWDRRSRREEPPAT